MGLFSRYFQRAADAAMARAMARYVKVPGLATAAGRSEPSNAELIAKALPCSLQRTHRDFQPLHSDWTAGLGHAAAMDGADGAAELEQAFAVQNTMPGTVFSWYARQGFIGHQACAVLAQHWLIDKACSQAPKDAVQNGFDLSLTADAGEVGPEIQARIEEINRERNILGECCQFARNARIFGIRHALFVIDGLDYAAPFNIDGVAPGSYRGISQIDPYWLSPEFDRQSIGNPAERHFYEPTWWRLPGGQRIHRSHFVIARESEVPDVLKPSYFYGGLPLPQLIFERVYAAERTANEAPEMAMTKRLLTMQANIENYISDEEGTTERLHAFNRIRSNFGFLITAEDENIQQFDISLADFDALIMTQYQIVAAIARTPATKLMGTTPKGFNATGEHESDAYDQELASIQTDCLSPLLTRHHALLARSEFSQIPALEIGAEWQSPRKPKETEKADIRLKKAQTSQALVSAGIVDPEVEWERLQADSDFAYAGMQQSCEDGEEMGLPGMEGDADV